MEAEFQAIPWMDQTAFFAVWERLLRTCPQGCLNTPVNLQSGVYSGQQWAQGRDDNSSGLKLSAIGDS